MKKLLNYSSCKVFEKGALQDFLFFIRYKLAKMPGKLYFIKNIQTREIYR